MRWSVAGDAPPGKPSPTNDFGDLHKLLVVTSLTFDVLIAKQGENINQGGKMKQGGKTEW